MKTTAPILTMAYAAALACTLIPAPAQTSPPLLAAGFEEGTKGWTVVDGGMSKAVPEAARNGSAGGLRITDDDDKAGASVFSAMLPAAPGATYALSFWGRYLRGGDGIAVSLIFYDADKKPLNLGPSAPGSALIAKGVTDWTQSTAECAAPAGTATLRVWIHSFYAAQPVGDLDDIEVVRK